MLFFTLGSHFACGNVEALAFIMPSSAPAAGPVKAKGTESTEKSTTLAIKWVPGRKAAAVTPEADSKADSTTRSAGTALTAAMVGNTGVAASNTEALSALTKAVACNTEAVAALTKAMTVVATRPRMLRSGPYAKAKVATKAPPAMPIATSVAPPPASGAGAAACGLAAAPPPAAAGGPAGAAACGLAAGPPAAVAAPCAALATFQPPGLGAKACAKAADDVASSAAGAAASSGHLAADMEPQNRYRGVCKNDLNEHITCSTWPYLVAPMSRTAKRVPGGRTGLFCPVCANWMVKNGSGRPCDLAEVTW